MTVQPSKARYFAIGKADAWREVHRLSLVETQPAGEARVELRNSSSWWQLETAGWAADEGDNAIAFVPADVPEGAALVLSAYRKDVSIGDTELRKLTENGAPSTVRRVPVRCGDFRGFHATYDAEESHWRVWWLASRATHVYATFNCARGYAGRHDAVLDWMLATLREVRHDA